MKRLIVAFVALTLFTGCKKEVCTTSAGAFIEKKFTASFEEQSKTSVSAAGKVDWTKDDVISYYSISGGTVSSFIVPESSHSVSISATVGIEDTFIVAAYGGEITSPQAKSMTLKDVVASEQTGRFEDAHVSVCKRYFENGNNLSFRNITSLIKFSLTRTDVSYLTFTATDGTKIHGDGTLSLTFDGEDSYAKFGDTVGGSTITVNTKGSGTFYISTLPCSINNFIIRCYNSENLCLGTVTGTKPLSLSSNKIVDIGTLDTKICPIAVETVSLNKTKASVMVAHTLQLVATILPSDAVITSVLYESSNSAIATVNKSGLVQGISEGKCTITITVNGEKQAKCEVAVSSTPPDLSADGTANCYIVSEPGIYMFNASVKGNSKESVGMIKGCKVLWESFGTSTEPNVGDIVCDVSYKDGYITFTAGKNGNAVISVIDIDGDPLWSWHIWVCKDFDPVSTSQVYKNDAGTMMDRNLGATSADPGDVHTLGLLYQWGRKDPFINSSAISKNVYALTTAVWPQKVSSDSSTGTIEYTIQHPMTFITQNTNNFDWYYSVTSSTDNTRWPAPNSPKGLYDPCPAGWRVPSNDCWYKAFGNSIELTNGPWDITNNGMNFGTDNGKHVGMQLGTDKMIWYPAAGCRDWTGSLATIGGSGRYWSCSLNSQYACYLFISCGRSFNPSEKDHRASCNSVRCLSE